VFALIAVSLILDCGRAAAPHVTSSADLEGEARVIAEARRDFEERFRELGLVGSAPLIGQEIAASTKTPSFAASAAGDVAAPPVELPSGRRAFSELKL
jgi:hypothetical protein